MEDLSGCLEARDWNANGRRAFFPRDGFPEWKASIFDLGFLYLDFASSVFLRSPSKALALCKFFSHALTFSASAIAMAPSGPMLLYMRPRVVRSQDRVDLQRLSDCLGTLRTDFVVVQAQVGKDRVDLQRLRDRDGSLWTDVVAPELELGQDPIEKPNLVASKLGNTFTDPKTAIHTCSQCSHNHFLQHQLKSTPVLHRVLHRCFPCISQIIVRKVEPGQDPIENAF
jgi:hypothetical protein